ncbi:MAG: hypothetical protein V3T69_06400, partial [Acidiferrobacterales bacterium]
KTVGVPRANVNRRGNSWQGFGLPPASPRSRPRATPQRCHSAGFRKDQAEAACCHGARCRHNRPGHL